MNEGPLTIARCINCDGITIEPKHDTCACGNELYPVVRIFELGKTYYPGKSGGDEIHSAFEGPWKPS